jgi:hypothetical protein
VTVSHVSDVTLLRRRYQLLPDGILPRVEEHLAECDICRNRSQRIEQSWEIFDAWAIPTLSEEQQKQTLEQATKRPMRRPMAPPPRPRGDERAADRVTESKGDGARTSNASPRRSPVPKYVAWGFLLLSAVLLGIAAALGAYLRSQRVDSSLTVTGPEEIEPGTSIGVRAQFTDAVGNPVKGAKVSVWLRGDGVDEKRDETKTDERGEAVLRLDVPKAGEYTATVEAQGDFEQRAVLLLSARARHQILLSLFGSPAALGGEISAKATVVTSGGQPLPNAPILFEAFEPSGTRIARVERRSNAQGSATISLPIDYWARPGLWTLSATAGAAHAESNFDIQANSPKSFDVDASAKASPDGTVMLTFYAKDAFGAPLSGTISAQGQSGELRDGFAQLELTEQKDKAKIEVLLESNGLQQKEMVSVERELTLSFRPENGAFHRVLPPRGIIQLKTTDPKPTKAIILAGEEEVASVDIDTKGYAVVDLPAKVLGRELTIKAEGAEFKVTPPVKDGPAVQCDRALAVVGKPLSCTTFYPKQQPILFVSQRGRLLTAIPMPPSQKPQSIEIPVPAAGILEVGFGGLDDLYAFVYATTPSGLSIDGDSTIAADDTVVPVDLLIRDGAGVGVAANVLAGVLLREPAPSLPTTHEPEAKFLLAEQIGVPARVQNISTLSEEGPRVNDLRKAYGRGLRWIVSATVVLFSLGIFLWVWFAEASFFAIFLPSILLATVAGVFNLWLLPAVFLVLLGIGAARSSQARPSIGSAIASISVAGSIWFSLYLWQTPVPTVPVPSPNVLQPRAVPVSPLPQIRELTAPFTALTTDAEGKVHWDVPRSAQDKLLHVYAEATAQSGFGSALLSLPIGSSAFSVSMMLPARMVQGDQVVVPLFARNLNNKDDELLETTVIADRGLSVRGASVQWQKPKGALAAEAQLTADAAGSTMLSLRGLDGTNGTTPILQEHSILVTPKNEMMLKSQWGQADGLIELPVPPKTASAKLWLFQDEYAAASWRLEQPLQPLSCTIEHAARLELLALLLQKQNTEELQRALRQSLEAIAASEAADGGFSICGGERFDLYTTAVTILALRNIAETAAIDPSLVARAREALSQNVAQAKPQPAEAAFYAWVLQAAGGDDPNSQKTIDALLKALPESPQLSAYALSLGATALQRAAKTERAQSYQGALGQIIGTSFSLVGASQPSISGAIGTDADIEATYFAALAFPKASKERQQLLISLANSSAQSNLLSAWVLRLLATEASEPSEINTTVSAPNALPAKLTQESPVVYHLLEFGNRPPAAIKIDADERFVYTIEFTTQAPEPNTPVEVKWPERLTRGDSFSVELSSPISNESLLVLPLPATVEPDHVALAAMQDSGAIGRFTHRDGALWVVLPPTTSPILLPMRAVRAGAVTVPALELSSISAPSKKEQTAPRSLEVRPQ